MQKQSTALITLIFINFFISYSSFASEADKEIEKILSLKTAPTGIVFEIVTGAANSLEWALPKTQAYIKKLRTRFPQLDIAIVTHGNEQFALTSTNKKNTKKCILLHNNLYRVSMSRSMYVVHMPAGKT